MPYKIKHNEEYYRQRKPQPDLGFVNNFKRFIWDPKRKAFLDRNSEEWANVGLFYLCFYGVLFSFSAFQLYITYLAVSRCDEPVFKYDRLSPRMWPELNQDEPSSSSFLSVLERRGPGLVVEPNIIPDSKVATIMLDEERELGQRQKYIDAIENLLSDYIRDKRHEKTCSDDAYHNRTAQNPCFFDIQELGECSRAPYGYTELYPQPCVYIHFNKRFGWVPMYFNDSASIPSYMPQWLQKRMKMYNKFHAWLSCEGKTQEDKELIGEIQYLPKPGFNIKYFPFSGQPGYLSPLVALRFKNLSVNKVVTVQCKPWALNIESKPRHALNFRILIKKPTAPE